MQQFPHPMRRTAQPQDKPRWTTLLLTMAAVSGGAAANNGVALPGYGAQTQGLAGTSIALPLDAAASANNPAGMGAVGDRFDADLTLISAPVRSQVGNARYKDDALIPVPTAGYNRQLNDDLSLGVSVFGHGVALDYGTPVYGSHDTLSKLQQVVLAPTLAWRVGEHQYLGVSPRLAYQRLHIAGLEGIGFQSAGADSAYGYGVTLGWYGQLAPGLNAGLTWSSRIRFGQLQRYRGLLPEGRLDLPQQAGAGLAWQPNPALTLAADWLWIDWSGERAYGNRIDQGGALGDPDGPGFGWRSQRVFRLGADYRLDDAWSLRLGYSRASRLIPDSQAQLAVLAPLAQYRHYALGATWRLSPELSLTGSVTHAPGGSVASGGVQAGTRDLTYFNLGIGWTFR
ncbi:aromatic hydrocarbon degradation protein [Xanthomonas sp. NCPPB 1128]|uniref:OmpP1/FadL family transporter n=1 Tax=Xanthomonas sp. NCPPB 1128 TaxID=1775876 RepID=UPI00065AB764|nr:outer membrane protein transport protein [Xanthomonas sp. NCPPB 1128]KMM73822.1 aromatic hydrocarbon degradation protein [Xanthomonas sp. NCPPB 1128]